MRAEESDPCGAPPQCAPGHSCAGDPDGSVDVETSDAVRGRRHLFLMAPIEMDPAWCERIDAESAKIAGTLNIRF